MSSSCDACWDFVDLMEPSRTLNHQLRRVALTYIPMFNISGFASQFLHVGLFQVQHALSDKQAATEMSPVTRLSHGHENPSNVMEYDKPRALGLKFGKSAGKVWESKCKVCVGALMTYSLGKLTASPDEDAFPSLPLALSAKPKLMELMWALSSGWYTHPAPVDSGYLISRP